MKQPQPPVTDVRKARIRAGLSQVELAKKVGISDAWLRNIEGGMEPTDGLKRKIAAELGLSAWDIWPAAQVPTNRFRILEARHGQDLKINGRQVSMVKEVVFQMAEGEFEELIASGTTPADALKAIRAFAKKHGIEAVK